jgi:hypothetical protein
MPDGRMTGRHRLTIQPNPLAEPARQSGVRIGKPHTLGPDAAVPTPEPAQRIAQRHGMLDPRQIVPLRTFASRTRRVRRPQPEHLQRRIPRRSISITKRPSSSRSNATTRYSVRPRIHVQSRSDPTLSSLRQGRAAGRIPAAQRSSPRRDHSDRNCRPERRLVGVSCG